MWQPSSIWIILCINFSTEFQQKMYAVILIRYPVGNHFQLCDSVWLLEAPLHIVCSRIPYPSIKYMYVATVSAMSSSWKNNSLKGYKVPQSTC